MNLQDAMFALWEEASSYDVDLVFEGADSQRLGIIPLEDLIMFIRENQTRGLSHLEMDILIKIAREIKFCKLFHLNCRKLWSL